MLIAMSRGAFDLDEYREACLTLGCRVCIDDLGDGAPIEGIAMDIDDGGRLIVKTHGGTRTISSGECLHLRASDPSN